MMTIRSRVVRTLSTSTAVVSTILAVSLASPASVQQVVDTGGGGTHDYGEDRQGDLTTEDKATLDSDLQFLAQFEDATDPANAAALADHGIYIVSDVPTISLAIADTTDSGMVKVPRPYVYWNEHIKRYTIVAEYQWRDSDSVDAQYFDSPCHEWNPACDVGGADGFGMRFNRNVTNLHVYSWFCGRGDLDRDWADFGCSTPRNPEDNSSAGVSYRKQDKVYTTVSQPDYNMYYGLVSMTIRPIRCGTTLQIYGRYAHTWDDTAVTGFGVGTDSFSIQWSNADHHWSASSQSGTWTRC